MNRPAETHIDKKKNSKKKYKKAKPDKKPVPAPIMSAVPEDKPSQDAPSKNEPNISERRGIRWVPGLMKEPTSTLVLTSSARRFVDIRIFCEPNQPLPNQGDPIKNLDWGIAGETTSHTHPGPTIQHPSNPPTSPNTPVTHSIFHHWLDSRTNNPDPDEGDMYPQPNNTTLELGIMHNPHTNTHQPYEEIWHDTPVDFLDGQRWSIVIDLDDPVHRAKGRVIRVGRWCQGIVKVDNEVAVERWKYEDAGKGSKGDWLRVARLGRLFLPCMLGFRAEGLVEGDVLTYGDYRWVVKEVDSW